jgi:hypothetical protein
VSAEEIGERHRNIRERERREARIRRRQLDVLIPARRGLPMDLDTASFEID